MKPGTVASGCLVVVAIFAGLLATINLFALPDWLGAPFSTEEIVLYRGAYSGPSIALYITDVVIIGLAVVAIVAVAIKARRRS